MKSLNIMRESNDSNVQGRNRVLSDLELDLILQQSIDSTKQLSSKQSSGKNLTEASGARKKNLFGLDFEIPDELQQLIVKEMKSKTKSKAKDKPLKTDYLNPAQALESTDKKLQPDDSRD